jgi:hypothetical protein
MTTLDIARDSCRSLIFPTRQSDAFLSWGPIIAYTLMLEIDDISRFPTARDFHSYCRPRARRG